MPTVDVGSRSLFYTRSGRGEPLFLIQGMAGHHRLWGEPLLYRLRERFDVICYDHRGVGESTDDDSPFTIVDLADDAAALLDALDVDSAHVMGISLGGMVAQELVLRRPELVRRLVIGCSYCGGPGSSLAGTGPMKMLQGQQTGDIEQAVRAGYLANLSPSFAADEANYPPFRDVALAVRVAAPLIMRQAQAAFGHDTHDRLPNVMTPTLVLHGTLDEMLVYSNGEQIAELIPGARLHTFADTGHLFWWEHPDTTADLIIEHCLSGTAGDLPTGPS